jgi:hypothetical protein
MVKLSRSRKDVRKSNKRGRSRRSLKKRSSRTRMMKGGQYYALEPIYKRKSMGSTLYELSLKKEGENTVYTLDFSKASGALVDVGMKIFKKNEGIAAKYSNTFIDAFGITDQDNKNKVVDIIGALFAEGVDGAKHKKLIITVKPSNRVDIKLTNDDQTDKEIFDVPVTKSFDDYLTGLGEGIVA